MPPLETLYLVLGATVLVLALVSQALRERLWLSEPLLALSLGVLVGPVMGWVRVPVGDLGVNIMESAARLTVAMSVMGVALRLPDKYLRDGWRPAAVMLLLVMPLMWLVSSALGFALFGLPLTAALITGAVVTPTDPVLADSIVTGELPERVLAPRVRHLISLESGANDGLAFLLVMLPVLWSRYAAAEALQRWVVRVLLQEVLLAIAVGAVMGWCTGWLVTRGVERNAHAGTPLLSTALALTLALLGGLRLVHADGLLAVFAAGLAMNWMISGEQDRRQRDVQDAITRFFDQPVFVLLGMTLPWSAWMDQGWRLVWFAAGVLVLRRIPAVLALRPLLGSTLRTTREALFVGWFGPVGAAALVYASWADVQRGLHSAWVIGSFVVVVSVLAHGVTATPLTRLFERSPPGAQRVERRSLCA